MIALIMLTIGTKFTDVTPDLVFSNTYMAAWMVPLISAVMIFLPLYLLVKLIDKYQLSLVALINKLTGKYVGVFINVLLCLFSLVSTALLLNNYAVILVSLYFPQTPKIVMLVTLAIVCFLMAFGGAYMIGRTAWIVLPYVKIALLALLILALAEEFDFSYLFPLFGKGMDVVIKESFLNASIFLECLFLASLVPFMKKTEKYSKVALIGLGIVAVEMSLFFVFYIILFDAYSLVNMILPFQHLTRAVELGRFITNFEGYFLAFWLVASIVKYATYLFVTTVIFTETFQLKSTKLYLIPITLLIVILGMLPENLIKSAFIYRDTILHTGSIIFFILPLLLWILSFRKKVSVSS